MWARLRILLVSKKSDREIVEQVEDGKDGTIMGPFKGRLTPTEIAAVAAYVHSLVTDKSRPP